MWRHDDIRSGQLWRTPDNPAIPEGPRSLGRCWEKRIQTYPSGGGPTGGPPGAATYVIPSTVCVLKTTVACCSRAQLSEMPDHDLSRMCLNWESVNPDLVCAMPLSHPTSGSGGGSWGRNSVENRRFLIQTKYQVCSYMSIGSKSVRIDPRP